MKQGVLSKNEGPPSFQTGGVAALWGTGPMVIKLENLNNMLNVGSSCCFISFWKIEACNPHPGGQPFAKSVIWTWNCKYFGPPRWPHPRISICSHIRWQCIRAYLSCNFRWFGKGKNIRKENFGQFWLFGAICDCLVRPRGVPHIPTEHFHILLLNMISSQLDQFQRCSSIH